MKRYIKGIAILAASYTKTLELIKNNLESSDYVTENGYTVVINTEHKCVDVLDNGIVIEQHYPNYSHERKNSRTSYDYVGEGNGDYRKTSTECVRKEYNANNYLIKSVSGTRRGSIK